MQKSSTAAKKDRPTPLLEAATTGAQSEREQRIAVAAYLRAERRRFAPGQELTDWLEAERSVDAPAEEDA